MDSLVENIIFNFAIVGIAFGLFWLWQHRRFESIKRNHQPQRDQSQSMRGAKLRSIATRYGFRFQYKSDQTIDDHTASFKLFDATKPTADEVKYAAGSSRFHRESYASSLSFANVISGSIGQASIKLFDHHFLPDCPDLSQTVLVIRSPEFRLPKFRIERSFAESDYEVHCSDPEHEMIFQQMVTQLPPHSFTLWIEGCGNTLLMCNQKSPVSPGDIDQFLDLGMDLLEIFAPSMSEELTTSSAAR